MFVQDINKERVYPLQGSLAVGSWTQGRESLCYKKLLESVMHTTTIVGLRVMD